MRGRSWRYLTLAVALAVFSASCGGGSDTTPPDTLEQSSGESDTDGAHDGHPDTTTTVASDHPETEGQGHTHGGGVSTPAVEPYPSVSLRILDDPAGGWLLHTVPRNFRLAPENVSTDHVDGEGNMHLYIDGVKVTRLYGEWHQMPPLAAGVHEIRVELSSNDHSAMSIDGTIVDDSATLEVSADEATLEVDDSMSDMESSGHDEADASKTISIEVVGGEPVGGHQRADVDLGSVVAVMVTSDTAEEVHVHGYDILRSVSPGQPLHFSFTADIPGVFEVELEGSGRLLLQLTVS